MGCERTVITRAEALAAGLSPGEIDGHVRAGRWRRVARGVYAPAALSHRPDARAAGAVAAFAAGAVAASHTTAARLHGIELVGRGDGLEREHVTVLHGRVGPSRPTIQVHRQGLDPDDVTCVSGVPVTTPARTLRDLLLLPDRLAAVWACEHAARSGIAQPRQVADQLAAAGTHPRLARAREWLALVRPVSESPLETAVRLCASDAGLPELDLQIPILDEAGRVMFRMDLGYPAVKLGIECDGSASHSTVSALYWDRYRANQLLLRGWRLLRFTWRDCRSRERYVAASIRAALDQLS
jgi:hypothetical protein